MQMWIDAHSHLTLEQLDQAQRIGTGAWVLGGIEPNEWKRQLLMKEKYPKQVFPVFGLHPWWIHTATREMFWEAFHQLEGEIPKAVALGETGLDAFKERKESLPLQREAFKSQVGLARKMGKPLVLHIVQAHIEAREFLKEEGQGIIHSFSGSVEDAHYYISRGYLISVSGTILKPGHKGLKQAVETLPLEKIVLETDSGDPKDLLLIAEAVAKIRKTVAEAVLKASTDNVRRVFHL